MDAALGVQAQTYATGYVGLVVHVSTTGSMGKGVKLPYPWVLVPTAIIRTNIMLPTRFLNNTLTKKIYNNVENMNNVAKGL